ncbi:MAG: DNA gyrase/topoisomerase IV subunit A [Bacteroidota bacterium]|nr:DNA gyrase/topoisomerase IV subunit A [Bacteroidota bacterium]
MEEIQDLSENKNENIEKSHADGHKIMHLTGMYENWFLDYASYVILERAVPEALDGLKPVQRRILHSMRDLDDGRYNKVANIIGHTMKYHPHGDASIGDALVQLGQKDLLIDCQGNWGNIYTGDSAAAPRYIEARLSKFALDVVFNPKTTVWKASYDGRSKEPVMLPVKFPLLLAQGVEGIAVGLASKILPHNFIELIDASVNILKGEPFELLPDFTTGGLVDCSRYNDGLRGGKVRVRAKIAQFDKKTLVITEIPFGTNTTSLIDTIISANDKGKIKIRKIDDNTAQNVEILIHLQPGVSPDTTIDALYAFTDCEIGISPNSCVIYEGRPQFLPVSQLLRIVTQNTVDLLKLELEIELGELKEKLFFSSLEKIFIEKRIFHLIENSKNWENTLDILDKAFDPYRSLFYREITVADYERLVEIRIRRIQGFETHAADERIRHLEEQISEVNFNLEHLIDYAIAYYLRIKEKYGKGRERKSEIRNFENIEAVMVAAANMKLYANKIEGFAGFSLKKDEFVCECSDIDDIIVFRENGTFIVTKVAEKVYVGENVVHIDIFRKNDDRTIYNMVYQDGKYGPAYIKRFAVKGITRDKEYDLTKGSAGSKILYFSSNPNGEAEVLKIVLKPKPKLKKTAFEYDFSTLAIKGRQSQGNLLTKYLIKKVEKKEDGVSTLSARNIWYDDSVMRLNAEGRGTLLGTFKGDDKILTVYKSGYYRLSNFDLSTHFDDDLVFIEKFRPDRIVTVVYYFTEKLALYIKRFIIEQTDKKTDFVGLEDGSNLVLVSFDWLPQLELAFNNEGVRNPRENEIINVSEFIEVKGVKAKGKRLHTHEIQELNWLEPLPYEDPLKVEEIETETEGAGENGEPDFYDPFPDEEEHKTSDGEATQMTLF